MSFISAYLTVTEGNESPLGYHLWSCIATLSTAAGRRFWFKLGRLTYYPNMYVLLVGDPGVKKTTAMNVGKTLIQETRICPVAASQATKEFFGKAMSSDRFAGKKKFMYNGVEQEYNQYAVFATEFTQFIAINPEGMLEFFTAVYDEKVHSVDTKNQGSDYVLGPYFTLLGCLTPHMLKGYLKMNVLTGGFARRTVFVYGLRERIIAIPPEPPPEAMEYLRSFIYKLQDQSGEFTFGPGAEEWYVDWYNSLQKRIKDVAKPSTEGYYTTKQELLIKTAMLIALSESEGLGRQIMPAHFQLAEKRFFAVVEKNLERVFEGAGINPNAAVAVQMCSMLEAYDRPMSLKYLKSIYYAHATSFKELDDTIQHLVIVNSLAIRDVKDLRDPEGKIMVTAIGTPVAMKRYSAVELAVEIAKRPPPPSGTDKDSGSSDRPPETPQSPL